MSHQPVSPVTMCTNPKCPTHSRSNRRMELELRYTDKKHGIQLKVDVNSPVKITVQTVMEDLLRFLFLEHISPNKICLIGFIRNRQQHYLDKLDVSMKIQDLGIESGCTLLFEPTPTAEPPSLCYLTLIGPDDKKTENFPWYREKTKLSELLKYVIEKFSLRYVERHRIHLLTLNEELDFLTACDKRLSEFNIYDQMKIHVQIIPPLSLTDLDENHDVHVECTDGDTKFVLKVPNTEMISELKDKIQTKMEDNVLLNFKLFSETKEKFPLDDTDCTNRTLMSFGIEPGQSVFATFCLPSRRERTEKACNESNQSKTAFEPAVTKKKHDYVTVICEFPSRKSETIKLSIKDTLLQLTQQINYSQINGRRLILSELFFNHNKISIVNNHDLSQCLTSFGIDSGDTIYVTFIDRLYTSPIVRSNPSTSIEEEDELKSRTVRKKPIGLDNLGNSCYMNSALQCLAHIPPLTNFFLESLDRTHMSDGEHTDGDWNPFDCVGDVTGAYAELLWNLWRAEASDHSYRSFKPVRIKEIIGSKEPQFSTADQQDAQEFMTFFLDNIHKELKEKNQRHKNTIIKQLFFGEMKSIITCTTCNKQESTSNPFSFLSIPLNQQERIIWINYITKTGRNCIIDVEVPMNGQVGHIVKEFVRFYKNPSLFYNILAMLPDGELDFRTPISHILTDEIILMEQEERTNNVLPECLEKPKKTLTLENCLQDFFSPEQLDGEWTCQHEQCKKKTTAIKRLQLNTVPPVIIIQFKRFSHENGLHQKIETFVKYPIKGLNLTNFLPSAEKEIIYDLVATSNHMGSIVAGHYTAYARDILSNTMEWYEFDDSCVLPVEPSDFQDVIVSREAYLLFYINRDFLNHLTTM